MMDKTDKACLLPTSTRQDAQVLYVLYSRDVEGAAISYRLFKECQQKANHDTGMIGEMIFHASSFVCAARRAGRLLEALSSKRSSFHPDVANVIKLEWKKKRAFFEKVIFVRNAVEHIDSETSNQTKPHFYNVYNNTLRVTDEHTLEIEPSTLEQIVSSRDAIAVALRNAQEGITCGSIETA